MKHTCRVLVFILSFSSWIVACGCGGASSGAGVTLSTITVAPDPATVTAGFVRQLTATGHYSDGSTKDLTSTASWASSSGGVATVTSTGLATGVSPGSASISATSGGEVGQRHPRRGPPAGVR